MSADRSVAAPCGFVVTAEGREAAASWPTCACKWEFDGGLIVCRDCGTVYSTKAQLARTVGQALRQVKQ
jgi:hypothetical protein